MANIVKENKRIPSLYTDFFGRDFFSDDVLNFGVAMDKMVPPTNVKETKDNFLLEIAVPGMRKEDVRINILDDTLTVEGKKEDEKTEETERYARREFKSSSFLRSFRLPKQVKIENIDAKVENGILKLVLPKQDDQRIVGGREIKVS